MGCEYTRIGFKTVDTLLVTSPSLLSPSVSNEAKSCGAGILGGGRVYGGDVFDDLRESTTVAETGGNITQSGWQRVLVLSELSAYGETIEERTWTN